MPNRFLKDSICTSETLAGLSLQENAFFFYILVACDDYGLYDARPLVLKNKLFSVRNDVSIDDVLRWLERIEQVGLIRRYTVDDKPYLQVIKWERHQQVRANRSKFPFPDGKYTRLKESDNNRSQPITDDNNGSQLQALTYPVPVPVPVPVSNPVSNPVPVVHEEISTTSDSSTHGNMLPDAPIGAQKQSKKQAKVNEYSVEFEDWYALYPRQEDKYKGQIAYDKLVKTGAKPLDLRTGALHYAQICRLQDIEKKFIKLPATFLNGRSYENYQTAPNPADYYPKSGGQNGRADAHHKPAETIGRYSQFDKLG